ncbi:hypothetical protein HJC23_010820 [Cyclotella cryptica]|uniref:SprT-like domain-containing protein n=1 Tax=Cyclotella cryptica TaxID=29204 RepID=A0ABD3QPX2_9STRA|eukprot:CCRYP_003565-RA/>CCRYP_003565-RA protein AED:0.08 eAED:0.12 QI:0/0.5/0/1/1/1/3/0/656
MPLDNIASLNNESSVNKTAYDTTTSNDSIDLTQLKARYDALLPKYGFLWRSMANKRMEKQLRGNDTVDSTIARPLASGKENSNPMTAVVPLDESNVKPSLETKATPSFLTAIETKQPISLRIHDACDDDCNCADPVVEIDENDSVYDARDALVDSDDDGEAGAKSTPSENPTNTIDDVEFEAEFADDESDEEVVVGRKPKTKTLVIESDDESSGSKSEEDSISLEDDESVIKSNTGESINDESIDKIDVAHDIVEERRKITSTVASNPRINSDDISSSSEVEWVELSSDEEEEIEHRPNQVNTVVILSSDEEEESESEEDGSDQGSVYTLDDSDSDEGVNSISSDDNSIRSQRKPPTKTSEKVNRTNDKSCPNNAITIAKPKSQLTSKKATLAFRKNRDSILTSTFSEFNRVAFGNALSSVQVTWSKKLNTTAGITRMKGLRSPTETKSRVATIELATKVIDNEERLRSTLLHEMCHAAAWLVDGVHRPPHGKCFKKWASISMKKIKDVEVTTTHDYQIAYKFAWACTSTTCNVVIKRHSRSVDPSKHCCGRCKSKLIEIEVPSNNTDKTNVGYTPKMARKPSDYALFLKEQTPHVRQRLANERNCKTSEISQADVMKECGKLWRSQKSEKVQDLDDGLKAMADKLTGLYLKADSP